MIQSGLKNYIKHSKYLLMTMGIIFCAMLIFVFIFFGGVLLPIRSASKEIFERVFEYFFSQISGATLADVFREDFIQNFVSGIPAQLEGLSQSLQIAVLWRIIGGVALVVVSEKLAEWLSKRAMRNTVREKDSIRGFAAFLIRSVASLAAWVLFFVLSYFWIFAIFLLPVVSYVLKRFGNMVSNWYIFFKNTKFKDVVNGRNFAYMLASDLLMIALHMLLIFLIYLGLGVAVALIFAFPLLSYNRAVMDTTSADYFRRLQRKGLLQSKVFLEGPSDNESEGSEQRQ